MVDPNIRCAKNVLKPELAIISNTYITSQTISKAVLKQKYEVEQLSLRQIAKDLSSSKTTIRNYLIKFNIPIKEAGRNRDPSIKRKYGEKLLNGKLIEHKQERRVIDSMLEMKEEGLSYSAIARVLNQMKVKTKTQGKSWSWATVRRIILRETTKDEKNE